MGKNDYDLYKRDGHGSAFVVAKGTPEDILEWIAEHVDPVKGLEIFLDKLRERLRYDKPKPGEKWLSSAGIHTWPIGWTETCNLRLILDPLEEAE